MEQGVTARAHAAGRIGRRARRAVAGTALLPLSGCSGGIMDPHGPVGSADRMILLNALVIMLAIVVPTIGATLFFAWRYRAGNTRARYLPDFVYSGRIEMIVWSIPIMIILFLSGVIWIGSHELDPAQPLASKQQPLVVQVVALDWKWLFIYPAQGVASINRVVVPADTPVHFEITSASVMNAFFVPQLGSMIYAMNGMVTQLWLQADQPGDYYGESSDFSGDGFSDMHFTVHAVPADAFPGWLSAAKQDGPALDRAAYDKLAQQSENVAPVTYRSVEPDLFQALTTQRIPPAPGPQVGRGGVQVHPTPEK